MTDKLRILAVDDNPQILKVMRRVLRDHDVVTCANGSEALILLEGDASFDVILSDMDMPVMSGADLYRNLAERSRSMSKRVVFVTGGGANKDQQEFLRSTGRPTVRKPFRAEELGCAIAAIVEAP
jgi:CheY-like chemotaxis protein